MSGYVRDASLRSGIFQTRRGPAASVANLILQDGEPGYEVDTGRFVVGDGTTRWASLPSEGHGTASDIGVSGLTSLVGSNVRAVLGDIDVRLPAVERGSLVPTAVKTANYAAAANDYVPVDTTSGAVTVTLPTAPADGVRVGVKHVIQASTNAVTIARGGSDVVNKAGGSTSLTLPLLNQGFILQYKASTGVWYAQSGDTPLSQLDARFVALSLADAKGDVFAATADNAVSRVAVGTDGQVLTADAASAAGLKWSAAAGGGAPSIVAGGNLGASRSETVAAGVSKWLSGTLTANLTLTPTLAAGSLLRLAAFQDATGGRTLTVTGIGALTIPTDALAPVIVDIFSLDGSTLLAIVEGQPGIQGYTGLQGIQGIQGIPGVSGAQLGLFGDGSDGAAVLDGTAAVTWATKVGSVYTMTRTAFCTTLRITSGATLVQAGWPAFANVSYIIDSGCTLGILGNNGLSGTTGSPGAASAAGRYAGGTTGSSGTTGVAGNAVAGMVGVGGAGGLGPSGAGGATINGNLSTVAKLKDVCTTTQVLTGNFVFAGVTRILGGGSGGSGGGGDGTVKGGGGGGGGTGIYICTPTFTNNGTILITGGNGGPGTTTSGNSGGGGGGSGGCIVVWTLNPATMGTINAVGGTGGAGHGTGVNGVDGSAGMSLNVVLA